MPLRPLSCIRPPHPHRREPRWSACRPIALPWRAGGACCGSILTKTPWVPAPRWCRRFGRCRPSITPSTPNTTASRRRWRPPCCALLGCALLGCALLVWRRVRGWSPITSACSTASMGPCTRCSRPTGHPAIACSPPAPPLATTPPAPACRAWRSRRSPTASTISPSHSRRSAPP